MSDYLLLIEKYFGPHLRHLEQAWSEGALAKPHFALIASYSDRLERRLRYIEPLGQTQAIVDEIGDKDPNILDKRLMNALAEIRTLSHLHQQGFTGLQKVMSFADIVGEHGGQRYAFQVTRITTPVSDEISRLNRKAKQSPRTGSPCGELEAIYHNYEKPLLNFFRPSIKSKNQTFQKWSQTDVSRCIVVVTSDENLQDSMVVRHIACRQIRKAIKSLHDKTKLHFEELWWLPDLECGARFVVDPQQEEVHCFVGWRDREDPFTDPDCSDYREVDLGSPMPAYL
ncbi:MAG: hypothetical protein K8J31_09050 [Anaerolineae bacterium]|nr:hypothetical protein [Anaerolineae bacterium]